MATAAKSELKGPQLESMEIIGKGEQVQIDYRSARGKQCRAVFTANEEVANALDRWSDQQRLRPPERTVLNDNAVRGWPGGRKQEQPGDAGQTEKGGGDGAERKKISVKDLKHYKAPKIPPKEARLAEEAKAIAAYREKDDYLAYWGIVALVSLISMMLLGL